ncbi:hypothetical protein CAEBREN_02922 [Caenorhabditis brenneri]|uniref:BRCT domain-containing protein n=1 Tax=Caenorhabditis brenneri TaxID=135651 RepID=G0M968_CAEBE|nr:hypothetical protein CAEBREN_02922 [Caenorhabditis brenneri]
MRTDSMFILFLILTSFSTTGVQIKGPAQSDLMQVSENFRILSRVTNAIHLHFIATQTDVKLHEIISEVMRISTEDFIGVIGFEASHTKAKISRMQKANQKYLEVPQDVKLEHSDISMAVHALNLWLSFFDQTEILEDVKNKNDTKITNKITYGGLMQKFENVSHKNLVHFHSLFDDDPASYELPNDLNKKTQETVKKFVKQSQYIRDCMGNLTELREELNSLEVMKTYETKENERKVRKLAGEFLIFYETSKGLPKTIGKLIENIDLTAEIWKPSKITKDISSEGLMQSLYGSVTSFKGFQNIYDEIELTHTAGFRNSKDLLQVFEDLKNPWFLKNVAKGASTKNLTQALGRYQSISEKIVSLDEEWKKMVEESTNLITPELQTAATTLKNITEFGTIVKKRKLVVNKTAENITNYFEDLQVSTNIAERLVEYDKGQRPLEDVVHQIRKAQQKISDLLSSPIYPKSEMELNSVIQLFDVLGGLTCEDELAAKCIFITKRKLITNGARDLKFFDLLKEFAELVKEINALGLIPENTVTPKVSIKDVVDELKLDEFAKKFKNDAEYIRKVISFFDFLKEIMKFPGDKCIGELNTYLSNFENVQKRIFDLAKLDLKWSKQNQSPSFLILPMNNSKALNGNLGDSLQVLENIEKARQNRELLMPKQKFSDQALKLIEGEGLRDWIDPSITIMELLGKADNLSELAGEVKGKDLVGMAEIFEKAADIKGLIGRQKQLNEVFNSLNHELKDSYETKYFDNARKHDLDFARHHSQLTNVRVSIDSLRTYFDEVFGHTKKNQKIKITKESVTIERQIPVSYTAIILIGVGFLLLFVTIAMVVYGVTEKGRTFYKNLYLYYFGKLEDFEKRWRYSLFMDTVDGKNSVLDAAREGNKSNLLRALKHGAYIDAYNKFGNTALHMATKFAQPELVRLLITYGADRSLLNAKNLAPIQMIPRDYEKKFPDKAQAYGKIKKIYKKYDRKSFRCSVPRVFPTDSFKIYPDESTDVNLTNDFLDAFRAIVSDEATLQTTHVVYKTDKDGVLVTDSLDALYWIFHGAIIVKEQWMTDCLQNEKLILKDSDYLIEKVKYRGVVYDTVLGWSEAMAKATMPYLTGIFVTVVADNFRNLMPLSSIVSIQGGVFLNVFPYKQLFNRDSKPYLHANMGPLFLIHDGNQEMDMYRNDPDKMYTVFTEEEFMVFMLKREMQRDTRPNPPSVLIQDE